ncbi:ABC transporter substrate-binding protein [Scytonema sp. UIC 10036]|uniref:bifunctional serine/threonine-protein kinase/ABC transporter substrate-binding protein n=1 Tax=Scytonema sp. UIC 10036 TaxID=2304196 RepID=UPI0012DA3A71|nr:bifunctional serine/threonine-protein kinase/ABC transporter substrate-binding protein [Scytonema sp. UIC 10036]MUG99660.1 ABC transporter substrate-binding protein [Scytonema sp. UIC 10036]
MVNSSPQTQVYCTRPSCDSPTNIVPEEFLAPGSRRFCSCCGMPLILGERFVTLRLLVPHEEQGGFGRTFLGQDLSFPHRPPRVIKQLYPQIPHGRLRHIPSDLEHIQELFKREARILSEFKHPQIPRAWAYFVAEVPPDLRNLSAQTSNHQSFFYLVQDYIEGQNLAQELQQHGNFSGRDVINLLQQILPVLDYIHNFRTKDFEGVLHRDIKPSNIMRSHQENNDGRNLYLIDFGAVKQVVVKGVPVDSSCVLGTPHFASPEQVAGRQISAASDLYSLAASCVCLLTGKNPAALRSEDSWDWRQHASVNENLADILDKMLLWEQRERYQSAREVLEALSAISALSVTPVVPSFPTLPPTKRTLPPPPPPSIWQKLRPIPKRWSWLSFSFLALLAIASTIIVFLTRKPGQIPLGSVNKLSLKAENFSRGENALIADAQGFSASECKTAYDSKQKGMEAFANASSPEAFRISEEAFKAAIELFKKVAVRNRCEVDPETWIYYYNSKAAQTTSASRIPTIAVVIPSASEDRGIAREILRGVAQVQHEQYHRGASTLQILIAKEDSNNIKEVKQVAKQISENNIPGELKYFKGSDILGVIGRYTSRNIWEAGKIYGDKQLVLIAPTSTAIRNPNIFGEGALNPHVFRTASNDSTAASDLADYMWKSNARKSLIVFEDGDPYSKSLKKKFEDNLISKGTKLQDILNCDLTSYKPEICIQLARNENVHALMLAPGPRTLKQALEIAKLNSKLGNQKVQLLAGDVLYNKQTLDDLGQTADGIVVAVSSHISLVGANTHFHQSAKELWATQKVSWRTLTAYDAAQAFVAALTKVRLQGKNNPSRQDIYERLKDPTFSAPSSTTVNVEFNREHDRKIVKGIGVLVQAKNSPKPNPNANNNSSDEYGFTLLEIPERNNPK